MNQQQIDDEMIAGRERRKVELDVAETYESTIAALRAELADTRAKLAERDITWDYVLSGFAITSHEEDCVVCGHNEVSCVEKQRLEAENMRLFHAVMELKK